MEKLLEKLFGAIFKLIAQVASTFLNLALEKSKDVINVPFIETGITFCTMVAGFIIIFSILKEGLYKIAGFEGDLEDLNGNLAKKIFMTIILIPLVPRLMKFIYQISFMIIDVLKLTVINQISGGGADEAIFKTLTNSDTLTHIVSVGFVAIVVFIAVFLLATMLCFSLFFVMVELMLAIMLSPIIAASLIKEPDKFNSLIENFISLIVLFGIQLFSIYWAMATITSNLTGATDGDSVIANGILAAAILTVASSPTVVAIIAKGRSSSKLQKLFYASSAFKNFVKK